VRAAGGRFSCVAHRTRNIGDMIQTIALTRLLPPSAAVFRHDLSRAPADRVFVVNGFLERDRPQRLGPDCLFAGVSGPYMRHAMYLDWLRRSPCPVGARDPATAARLSRAGISAELVGCATLTLPGYDGPRREILSVDFDGPGTRLTHAAPHRGAACMKTLFVLDQFRDGGAQIQALDLGSGLLEQGISCSAVALYTDPIRARHMGVEPCGLGVSTSAARFPPACLRLLKVCRAERPDFIHSHAEVPNLASRIVCRWLGLPHFVTAHCEFPWNWRRTVGVGIERRTSFLTSRYFAVSEVVCRVVRDDLHVRPDRIRVIPNWPPRHAESSVDQPMPLRGSPTIVNVARLHRHKRQDILIESFREVRRQFPEAILWIAGTGPEESRLRSMAGDGVMLLGHRNDVRRLLRADHGVARYLASYREVLGSPATERGEYSRR
jgi:hypothetical protein